MVTVSMRGFFFASLIRMTVHPKGFFFAHRNARCIEHSLIVLGMITMRVFFRDLFAGLNFVLFPITVYLRMDSNGEISSIMTKNGQFDLLNDRNKQYNEQGGVFHCAEFEMKGVTGTGFRFISYPKQRETKNL
jgi:hypothetical protein